MKREKLKIPFRLIKIEEVQFSLFDKNKDIDSLVNQNIGFGFGVSVEDSIIACSMSFTLEKEEKPFINIEVVCHFEIEKEKFKRQLLKEGVVKIDKSFACHLAMITTGTTRGVLYANTKNTSFEKYFIRLLNIDEIINEDIEIVI